MSNKIDVLEFIICTRDRFGFLPKIIEKFLCHKNFNPKLRVILNSTNNKDTQQFNDISKNFSHKNIDFVTSPVLGLSKTRNFGLKTSKYSYIWFLDDDIIMDDTFIPSVLNFFKENDKIPNLISGKVYPIFEESPQNWLLESKIGLSLLSCLNYGDSDRFLSDTEHLVGANFCVKRDAALTVGGFDEQLGRSGNSHLMSNEEFLLSERIKNHFKTKIFYFAKAEVGHFVPKERMKYSWLQKRMFWQSISDLLIKRKFNTNKKSLDNIFMKNIIANKSISGIKTVNKTHNLDINLAAFHNFIQYLEGSDD